ncbi:MAG: hypothetical protein JO129_02905 [Candidatus Dependentiae bacterium]|nr:hypothetical protein [Candidatus Dependentiae bacterium]
MRIWIIFLLTCGLLYGAVTWFKTIKFDTAVSVTVTKGPFKGLSFKLVDYKVSYNDLHVKNEFWESKLGKAIFRKLSSTLQTLVIASKKYVDVQFEVNYLGLLRRHYRVIEVNGEFDVVGV